MTSYTPRIKVRFLSFTDWERKRELQMLSAKMRWYMTQVIAGGTWTLILLRRGRLLEKLSLRTWWLNPLKETRSQPSTEHTGTHSWGQGGSGGCWSRSSAKFYLLCCYSSGSDIPKGVQVHSLGEAVMFNSGHFYPAFIENNVKQRWKKGSYVMIKW